MFRNEEMRIEKSHQKVRRKIESITIVSINYTIIPRTDSAKNLSIEARQEE